MRDFESERPRVKKVMKYVSAKGQERTVAGYAKPYNELLYAIGDAAQALKHEDRKALQRLAWFLGMNGETHACEVIMEHAKEPVPYHDAYMYGVGIG